MNNNLILLALSAAVAFSLYKLYWYCVLERIRTLRRGGDEGRKRFEVQLASGITDAPARIARVIDKFDRHAAADQGERNKGRGSIDIIILATKENGITRVVHVVECDEAEYPAVKRVFKQAFRGFGRISTPDLAHLDAITEGLREPASANESFGVKAKKLIKSLQQ